MLKRSTEFMSGDGERTTRLLPIEARGLTVAADAKVLLGPIDLVIEGGCLTTIMGPNGAGKTVLLRALHGLVAATSGTVRFAGRNIDEQIRKRQAMVFQKPVLLRRSVAANLDFALSLAGPVDPHRRDTLLDHVGLLGHAAQPARRLSGGEQQRLALARALARDPEILFLDEPTASLDPGATRAIEEIVLDAQGAGTKIIFVTHDIGQARRLGGDIVVLHRGSVIEQARAEKFFAGPQSEVARAYLAGRVDF